MSQLQTVQTMAVAGRYSKRKRAQINYYEGDVDNVEDVVFESQHDVVCSKPKKQKATKVRSTPKRKVFPFLSLPAEIRNMIYGYCLTDNSGINLVATFKKQRRSVERVSPEIMGRVSGRGYYGRGRLNDHRRESSEERFTLVPSLLAVNKQIYQEGRDILYGNKFICADTLAMHSFLVNLGPRATTYLKYVTLANWGFGRGIHKAYNHASFALLALATNIEKFTLDAKFVYYGSTAKSAAQQLYRDGFPWLEAVGAARGRINAAVDVIEISDDNFKGYWPLSQGAVPVVKQKEEFGAELSKLLEAHMNMIRSKPAKKKAMKRAKNEV